MKANYLLFLILSLHLSCRDSIEKTAQTKVVGGTETKAPRWFASLFDKREDQTPFCGAVSIGNDQALTAAHCVANLEGKIFLRFGVDQLPSSAAPIAIESIWIHPQYQRNKIEYDIALLKLKPNTENANGILIANTTISDQKLRVYGLGALSSSANEYPDHLQYAELKELSLSECRQRSPAFRDVTSAQICAIDPDLGSKDSCYGDSGGPLVIHKGTKPFLYGLVSWGVSCGRSGLPGIYTRVSSYSAWLKQLESEEDLSSRISAIFYHSLDSVKEQKRFSARFLFWRKPIFESTEAKVDQWSNWSDGREYSLALLKTRKERYKLRLNYANEVWEAPVHFTELNTREDTSPEEAEALSDF